MSKFTELMSKPLPSKLSNQDSLYTESVVMEDDMIDDHDDSTNEIDLEDIEGDIDDIPEDVSDLEDEIANLSEEDLDDLGDEMDDDDDLGDDLDNDDLDDEPEEEDEEEVDLDDQEEIEADKYMSLVATPTVLKNELTEEECKEFAESADLDIAIEEGFFLESDEDNFFTESADLDLDDLVLEAGKFAPKTKVVFSVADRKKQLFEVGVFASARAHNDRGYWKLQKLYRAERIEKAKLRKKYKAEALKRVKVYIARLKKSKSGILSKIADKITGK